MRTEDEIQNAALSSSEEERDDRTRRRDSRERVNSQTPYKGTKHFLQRASSTPMTVTQMTPSPIRTPLADAVSPNPSNAPTRAPGPTPSSNTSASFVAVQRGYLDRNVSTALFRDVTPSRTRRKSRTSSRRSRMSQSLLLDSHDSPMLLPVGSMEQRRLSQRKQNSFGSSYSPGNSSPDSSSTNTSPETSPNRNSAAHSRMPSLIAVETFASAKAKVKSAAYIWGFLALVLTSCVGMICLTRSAVKLEQVYEPTRPEIPLSAAGLRGQMTSGHWEGTDKQHHKQQNPNRSHARTGEDLSHLGSGKKHARSHKALKLEEVKTKPKTTTILSHKMSSHQENHENQKGQDPVLSPRVSLPKMHLPPPTTFTLKEQKFESQDPNMYARHSSNRRRVVALDPANMGHRVAPFRSIKLYPADFTDNTQLYSILDSSDERLDHMERREPYVQGECVPMRDWQTTFHPSCNGMHEIAIENMGEENGNDVQLFGTKGFWRYAWRLDVQNVQEQDTMVLKTLKFEHNFEDAHFEHDRIDAVAMERLTSSPHVINLFGFCGHSVLTEYADGSRVGELADKSKKKALTRLKIARDIAQGLADVHGIDGDGNATFVHLDVNPANVVSIGGTLKLNDFNIGIIRRWNTTSNTPCGFPAQYPNPQWRSPEEARNEQNLTEKVDVFSMGHIFFRLICGHEPWNKLEPGGRPSKEEVSTRVQRGDLPFIPDHVQNSENPEVVAIRDAMLSCYTYDPIKRPSARHVANVLDTALESLSPNQG